MATVEPSMDVALVICRDAVRRKYVAAWYRGGDARLDNQEATISGRRAGEIEFGEAQHGEYIQTVRELVELMA
jgi:hypothetical protein